MRILKLRFRNLNSLAGEWTVDFTDPAFAEDGLFAIVGPTGAGKTTILDALSLALFQRTPRLKNFSKTENEIMSRQTNDCMAEVTFSAEGKTYRASFEQKRSRAGSQNPFGEVKCELAQATGNADGDEVLATKKQAFEEKIKAILHLDFDQFSRSVLLAQGQFRDFLFRQSANERAELLEKITGTGIYTEISKKVSELYGQKKRILENQTTGLEALKAGLLGEEEAVRRAEEREKRIAELSPLEAELRELETQIARRKTLLSLESERATLEAHRKQCDADLAAFAPEKKQLERHRRAVPLKPLFRETEGLRKALAEKRTALETEKTAWETVSRNLEELLPQMVAAKASLQAAEQMQAEETPLLAKVRIWDQEIKNHEKAWNEAKQNLQKRRQHWEEIRRKRAGLESDKQRVEVVRQEQTALREARRERLGERTAAEILTALHTIQERHRNWQQMWDGVVAWEKNRENQAVQAETYARIVAEQTQYQAEQRAITAKLEALREEIASQNRTVQRSEDVENLKEYRSRLTEGEPCPLCGATHHPLELPQREITAERARQAALKEEEQRLLSRQVALAEKGGRLEADGKHSQQRLAERVEEETDLQQRLAVWTQQLALESLPEKEGIQAKITELEAEETELAEDSRQAADWDAKIAEKTSEMEALERNLKSWDALEVAEATAEREQTDALEETRKWETAYMASRKERQEKFQDKNPDDVERALAAAVREAHKEYSERKAQKEKWEMAVTMREVSWKRAASEVADGEFGLARQEAEWAEALRVAQFTDERDFLAAQLTQEEQERKEKRQEELHATDTRLKIQLQSVMERLEQERRQPAPTGNLEELLERQKRGKEQQKKTIECIGMLEEQLRRNRQLLEKVAEETAKIEGIQRETDRWQKLHQLIGGERNPRFRRLVQRLSLEILLGNANLQLQRLAPRYLLVLPSDDGDKELSIACRDTFFNDEIRPVSNLSGGETFLVSLALALGLSKMSSRNVPMESLFLDEGFGTLDEETLQAALESLSLFQSGGGEQKLIGIISHVETLKERIANKIEVLPGAMGRSRLQGNGIKTG
ncbi:MAG: AAA family ATPase [Planctomycetia bacterium]|nr:AAA family ATPase [Planctomycetia bacterium]